MTELNGSQPHAADGPAKFTAAIDLDLLRAVIFETTTRAMNYLQLGRTSMPIHLHEVQALSQAAMVPLLTEGLGLDEAVERMVEVWDARVGSGEVSSPEEHCRALARAAFGASDG